MNAKKYNALVPENIKRIVSAKGLKYTAVAARAGVSGQQLCDMINGRKIIKPCDTLAIADALGVPVADLYVEEVRE